MTRLAALLTVLFLAAPLSAQVPELRSADAKKLLKGVGEWVVADIAEDAEGRLDGRDELQKALEGLMKKHEGVEIYTFLNDWGQALEQRGGKYAKAKAGALAEDEVGGGAVTFRYWVPGDYNPKKASVPLVLWFRDSALDEDAVAAIPDAIKASFAVMAVEVPGGDPAQVVAGTRLSFFRSVLWTSQQLRIDRNRVYVVADGEQAATAAKFCALAPHVAAGMAVVGGAGDAPAGNLALLAGNEEVDSLDQAWAWVEGAAPRNPYPTEFEVQLNEAQFGRIFWVQAIRFDPSLEGKAATMKVKADRASNRITIEAENVYQVDVYLNDQLVDLAKPVTIVCNGQEVEMVVPAGYTTLLESYKTMLRDSSAIYPSRVRQLDIPAKE